MKPTKKLTRKELAQIITERRGDLVTVKQVRDNEERWGLKAARGVDLNRRVIRYCVVKAMDSLRRRGIINRGK